MADERRRNNPLVGGKQLLTWWMWILREPTDREEKNPLGMNKLFEGIPPEFADVALDWSGKKWYQKSAEWNFWFWIYNS